MDKHLPNPTAFLILRIIAIGSLVIGSVKLIAMLYLMFFATYQRITPGVQGAEILHYSFSAKVISMNFLLFLISFVINIGLIYKIKAIYILELLFVVLGTLGFILQSVLHGGASQNSLLSVLGSLVSLLILGINYKNFFSNK